MKALINLRHLLACNQAASDEETRYYLQGVNVSIHERHSFSCATDGHMLICARNLLHVTIEDNTLLGSLIIPSSVIATIKPADVKHTPLGELTRMEGERRYLLTVIGSNRGIAFEAIDGCFPDWRRIIPAAAEPASKIVRKVDTVDFNPMLLMRFWKAAEVLSGAKHKSTGAPYTLTHNGAGPAYVNLRDIDAFGVVMPYRKKVERGPRPEWIEWQDATPQVDEPSPPSLAEAA